MLGLRSLDLTQLKEFLQQNQTESGIISYRHIQTSRLVEPLKFDAEVGRKE